ncbi:MAG: hypothetical protein IT352_15765 [Gemmatimonadales bacterium]|nr:hypothetical protein [Gemmatimonadales bacterium]
MTILQRFAGFLGVETRSGSGAWLDASPPPQALFDPQQPVRGESLGGFRCGHCGTPAHPPLETDARGFTRILLLAARFARVPDSDVRLDVPIQLIPPGRPGTSFANAVIAVWVPGSFLPLQPLTVGAEAAAALTKALDKYIGGDAPRHALMADARYWVEPFVDVLDPVARHEADLARPPAQRLELAGPFRDLAALGPFRVVPFTVPTSFYTPTPPDQEWNGFGL